jgi:mRNA-degrading endonuclease RelE of RelBE toxin-antitoxin system
MVKEVIRSPRFIGEIKRIDKSYLERVKKLIIKIIENPEIGKPMKYARKGTREVYLGSFRISYAYDLSTDILTFLDIYHKDEQ